MLIPICIQRTKTIGPFADQDTIPIFVYCNFGFPCIWCTCYDYFKIIREDFKDVNMYKLKICLTWHANKGKLISLQSQILQIDTVYIIGSCIILPFLWQKIISLITHAETSKIVPLPRCHCQKSFTLHCFSKITALTDYPSNATIGAIIQKTLVRLVMAIGEDV